MTYRKILLLLILQCFLCTAYCQTLTVPYQFGFEDGKGDWTLNVGRRGTFCKDRWVVRKLERSEGYQSLYISCDRGKTSNYGSEPNVVVASTVLELPTGNYDISFDWRVWGEPGVSELYVCALSDGYVVNDIPLESNDSVGFFPKGYSRFIQPLMTVDGERLSLSGATSWSNASLQLSVIDGRKVKLAFVWCNANQDTLASPLGACIDNIQINSAMCPKPENLSAESECGVMTLKWDGLVSEYECGYRRLGSNFWNNEYDIDGEVDEPSFTWDNIEEGAYDLRVRAIDGNDTSAYVYLNTVVVWCPDNHCFDFVSLDNDKVVTCEHGKAIEDPLSDTTEYSMAVCPPIDFGSSSIYSRHTTNWDQSEVDPRTGNKLTLIPEGGLASVRLGNWNSGGEAERITYEFDVVGDLVLLMKYAVVLEKPGHGELFDPYFGLEILKEDGSPISKNATCGEAFFSPETGDWEKSGAYVWKNWTTIGIDLRECKGQKIKIQLTTQDCTRGAHGGYAYFTLDCVDATIKSDGCDTVSLEAPAGFKYLWSNDVNSSFSSTDQKIFIPVGDNSEYFCNVTYLDNEDCSFVLSSSVVPNHPKASFEYNWEPKKCNNIVNFKNTSYVYAIVNGKDSIIEGKRCAHYEWEFNFNGEIEKTDVINPRYTMPNEGGVLDVKLWAYLEDEECVDVFEKRIIVDSIYPHDVTMAKELCFGDYFILGDNFAMESGTYIDTVQNIWGCDSITTLYLTVRPKVDDVILYDTLCSMDPYIIGNYRFDSTGVYNVKLQTSDSLKCDSIVILHLEKIAPLAADISNEHRWSCADDSILEVEYELVEGARNPFVYSIVFDDFAHSAGFVDVYNIEVDSEKQLFRIVLPNNCRPDHYEANILLNDSISTCGDVVLPVKFDVYYSSSILESKFDNLITVLNKEANGGYEFDQYRWFRDGVLIPDANESFYLLPEGKFSGECYYLEVRRVDDGVVMRTCDICLGVGTPVDNVYFSEPYVVNTIIKVGESIVVANVNQAVVSLYTIAGQLVGTQYIESDKAEINLASLPGIYMLQVATSNGIFTTKIIITE